MATCAATPATPSRRPQLSLNEEVCQAAPGNVFCAGLTTPANHVRPNLNLSVSTGTPTFRGSGVASHAVVMQPARPATADVPYRPDLSVQISGGVEPTPPVMPSPTNAQRQPMMARSSRSTRAAVLAANWGPEVSSALATSLPMRPCTAPSPPATSVGGYQAPSLDLESMQTAPAAPTLDTPTNAQRQPMMSRSNRSVRHRVMTATKAEIETVTPSMSASMTSGLAPLTMHAGATPKPRGLAVAALEADSLDSAGQMKGLKGLSTPTNLDRRDAQMSLQLGTPSFRGSATTAVPAGGAPTACSPAPPSLSGTRQLFERGP